MNLINTLKSTVFDKVSPQHLGIYLVTVSAMAATTSTVLASTEPLTQFCTVGNLFIPVDQLCSIPLQTTVNGMTVPVLLDATTYYPTTNEVEYNLLSSIELTLPGPDGDQVNLNGISIFLDPVLEFEASFIDQGEASPFEVTFTSFPFAPTVSVRSFISGVLTDNSSPKDGVSLDTSGLVTYEFLDAEGNLVDSLANTFNIGASASFSSGPANGSGDSHDYDLLTTKHPLICNTLGCGAVQLSLAFTGSGQGDRYDFTSRSEVTASVAEPTSIISLIGVSLASFWGLKRKNKQK